MFRSPGARSAVLRSTVVAQCLFILAACSTLPDSGPTGRDIFHAARPNPAIANGQLPFRIVEVADAAAVPPPAQVPSSALLTPPPEPTDLIGPGDVLNITIYEAGVSLFGKGSARVGGSASVPAMPSTDQSAGAEHLPAMRVDDQGFIRFPFIGRIHAAGHTTSELESIIRSGLRGMSQDPQVMVSNDQSITNSVVLAGEVNRPGRFTLPMNHQTLNETIALAGGYRGDAKDVVARVQRRGESFEIRLADLLDMPQRDLPIAPGDRITLISRPESFSVLGAPNRVEEIRFPKGHVSVAEAVALAGGANPNSGDASAIFVFRYEPNSVGSQVPVVYHLNMMRPQALLLSQQFMMKDKDLLYIGNSEANQPSKFIQLLSQLFLPVATVRTTVQ